MLECLEETLGIVTPAAKKAGISRDTHYAWMKADEQYRTAVDDLQNVVLDFAEHHLLNRIKAGSDVATIFILKTLGKKRGYVEKQQVEHSGEVGISWHEERTYEAKS